MRTTKATAMNVRMTTSRMSVLERRRISGRNVTSFEAIPVCGRKREWAGIPLLRGLQHPPRIGPAGEVFGVDAFRECSVAQRRVFAVGPERDLGGFFVADVRG